MHLSWQPLWGDIGGGAQRWETGPGVSLNSTWDQLDQVDQVHLVFLPPDHLHCTGGGGAGGLHEIFCLSKYIYPISIYYKSSRVLIMIFAFHPNDYQHNYSSPRVPTSVDRRILTGLGREGENDSNPPVRLPPCPSEPQLILVNTCLIHAIWKRSWTATE